MYWHKQTGWLCNMLFGGMLSTPAGLGNEQQDFPTSEQEELQGSTDASLPLEDAVGTATAVLLNSLQSSEWSGQPRDQRSELCGSEQEILHEIAGSNMRTVLGRESGLTRGAGSLPDPPDLSGNERNLHDGGGESSVMLTWNREDSITGEGASVELPRGTNIGDTTNTFSREVPSNSGDLPMTNNDNRRVYKDAKHNEFQQSQFNAPVAFGSVVINNSQKGNEEVLREFAKIHCADAAAFNSRRLEHEPTCCEGTRVDLLKIIMRWADNPTDTCIFWLNGMAGTGKSTIARTVAGQWHYRKRLGASFFFSRTHKHLADGSRFFPTLAYQLGQMQNGIAADLRKAICDYPDIPQQGLREQWGRLFREPLSQRIDGSSHPHSVMMVIDALDECEDENDTQLILQLLSEATNIGSMRLRVLITSRPEIPIRRGFDNIPSSVHRDFILHSIPNAVVDLDISAFLRHEFDRIVKRHKQLHDWPDEPSLESLVQKADGLFLYAATACRFIGDQDGSPAERLMSVLEDSVEDGSPTEQLDLIYTKLLQYRRVVTGGKDKRRLQRFHRIVGPIALLFDNLTAGALSQLLDAEPWEVQWTLEMWSSVLGSGSKDICIKLLHPSLRDFLLDGRRCTDLRFWIEEEVMHRDLVVSCLSLLSRSLKRDMCSLGVSDGLVSELSRDVIQQCLQQEVQYACRYWVEHLHRSNATLGDGEPLHDQVHAFLKTHLLHWLKTLSLMGELSDGVTMLKMFEAILTSDSSDHLRALSHDAVRFVLNFRSIIEIAPLQLYCSALLLTPKDSPLREQYRSYFPDWIITPPVVAREWDSTLQSLVGHSQEITGVALSLDGKSLASSSADGTLRLWDPMTGTCRSILEGHSGKVGTVAFSPDGRLLASGSHDSTVRLWDPVRGMCLGILEGHSNRVDAVVFSPDGGLLASASNDGSVRLWEPSTGICRNCLEGHSNAATAVAFSPNGMLLASGSADTFLRLWDPTDGSCHMILEGHSDTVTAVVFAPGGEHLASGSDDGTIRLWDSATGTCDTILVDHPYFVKGVAFSPDGMFLASGSTDNTVRLWDATTGICHRTLVGHSHLVSAVVFSPDGKLLVSGSRDSTMRLWDLSMAPTSPDNGECHSGWVNAVVFSPDGRLLASASNDTTIRLWDPITGTCHSILSGHSQGVRAVIFSPDGLLLASGAYENTVRLWDSTTGTCLSIMEGHSHHISAVVFSPDGQILASGSSDSTVRLWDRSTGACRTVLQGHTRTVSAVAFSPDNRQLASASHDTTIRLWDTATGICGITLMGHSLHTTTVTFSPDGRLLASGSMDRTVRLWDPAMGMCIAILDGHAAWISAVEFSLDGTLLTAILDDKTVLFWEIREEGIIEVGRVAALPLDNGCGITADQVTVELSHLPQLTCRPTDSPASALGVNGDWIFAGKRKLFLLPPDYRANCSAVRNGIVALGQRSGRVSFVAVDLDKVPCG